VGKEALNVPLFNFGRQRRLGRSSGEGNLLCCAGFAYTWTPFQVRDFPAGETTIMDEPFTDAATRPASTEQCEVPVQPFLTHPATFRFDTQ